jgi:hypothetical protein
VFSGALAAIVTPADATCVLTGEDAADGAGDVAAVGDVDGDGRDDLLVGVGMTRTFDGRAYLFYGPLAGTRSLASADVVFTPEGADDRLGAAVAVLGDIDGDAGEEIALGAPWADGAGAEAGAVYVFTAPPPAGVVPVANAPLIVTGAARGHWFGGGVGGAGDVDGDGHGDFVAGAVNTGSGGGTVYVFYGPFGGGTVAASAAAGAVIFAEYDDVGGALRAAGDTNGDGRGDLLIGSEEGEVWLVFGGMR